MKQQITIATALCLSGGMALAFEPSPDGSSLTDAFPGKSYSPYLEPNELDRNSYNNVTTETDADGAVTIHFGGCEDGRINCIPISPGWNYAVRMYQPQEDIQSGEWTFPLFVKAK